MSFFGNMWEKAKGVFSEAPEMELANDPSLDAESVKIHSNLQMLNAKIGATPVGGMTMKRYFDLLKKEGRGR